MKAALKLIASALAGGAGGWSWLLWLALGASAVGGATWWHNGQVRQAWQSGHATAQAKALADQADAINTAQRENAREITRLVHVNQEVQRAYNQAIALATDNAAARARTQRLRDTERAAIVAAAERAAAGTCGRYAAAAERDLDDVEADATALGHQAITASAAAHALKQTIDQRRAALDAKRQALNPQAKHAKEPRT